MGNRSLFRALAAPAVAAAALLLACGGGPERRGAVLIVVDGARFDEVGRPTVKGEVTPFLDTFTEGATRFLQATAPAPWTLPSMASILTSLYPTVHGAGGTYPEFRAIRPAVTTAPELLESHGVRCAAFVNGSFLAPSFGFARGFETYDHAPATAEKIRAAGPTLDAALHWLGANGAQPFFMVVHLVDPLMDFDPPEPFRSQFLEGYTGSLQPPFRGPRYWREAEIPEYTVRGFAKLLYRAELCAVDNEISRFLAGLDSLGLAAATAVVVTSPAGLEMWEHGRFGRGHTMYEEQIHVPLVMRVPWRDWPAVVKERVGTIDIMPTLFDLLDVPLPGTFQGEPLAPFVEGRGERRSEIRFSESVLHGGEMKAAVDDRFKLIARIDGAQKALLDLLVDPHEKASITKTYAERTAALEARLADWLKENLGRAAESGDEGMAIRIEEEGDA